MNDKYSKKNQDFSLSLHLPFNLTDLCALYIVCWAIIPAMSRGNIFRIFAIICSIEFILYGFLSGKFNRGKIDNYFFLAILMITILLGHNILGNGNLAIARSINLFVSVIISMIAQYYYNFNIRKLKKITIIIILIYILEIIPSLIAVAKNPYVLRNAAGEHVRAGIEAFAGSYGYVYGCVLLVTFFVYDLHKNKKKLLKKMLQLFAIISLCYLILKSGFTTALILTIIGIISALCIGKNELKTLIFTIIVFIFLSYIIPLFLHYIVENLDIPIIYKSKILYLNELFASNQNVTYGDSTRGKLLNKGFTTILKYPILGSVIFSGVEEAGGHQEIVDVMANYGIIYAILFYYIILGTPYRLLKLDKHLQLLYLIIIVLLGMTNTIDYATLSVALFVGTNISLSSRKIKKRRR